MDDTDLDSRLRAGAPRVTNPVGLGEHRARIVREARAKTGRRLRMWSAATAATVVLVGGGSVAMAASGSDTPWGWLADNVFAIDRTDGSACFQGMAVTWEGVSEDDPLVVDAKAIVAGIDLNTLDTSAVEEEIRVEHAAAAAAAAADGQPLPVEVSAAEVKQEAIGRVVGLELFDALHERGYEMTPGHEVSLDSQIADCR